MQNDMIRKLMGYAKEYPKSLSKYTVRNKAVQCIYASGQEYCTLSPTVATAVEYYRSITEDGNTGGIGTKNTSYIAEMRKDDDSAEIAVRTGKGGIMASKITSMGTITRYSLDKEDGAILMLAMMPTLLEDNEFKEAYERYAVDYDPSETEVNGGNLALMSENVYRRIMLNMLEVDISTSNLPTIKQAAIDSGTYNPDTILAGNFQILQCGGSKSKASAPTMTVEEFTGKYKISEVPLSAEEANMVPVLADWYVVSEHAIDMCEHIFATKDGEYRMRNFLLRGPAGTGKSQDAIAVAAGLEKPYVSITCNPGTEIFDLMAQVLPVTEDNESLKTGGSMLGCSFTLDDLNYDPEGVYEKITGKSADDVTFEKIIEALTDKASQKPENSDNATRYRVVESPLVAALKHGWVCEIREPSIIANQGVLVGLNTILEQDGVVSLMTGESFVKHPDTVIIMTTNSDYEGCRNMNQSVRSRMNKVFDVEEPDEDVMVRRAMNRTGETNEDMVREMVDIVKNVKKELESIGDYSGEAGMRPLMDWIISTRVTKNPYKSAKTTIIAQASIDAATRDALISKYLDSSSFVS